MPMIYVAAAYSTVVDKAALMDNIMRFTGEYMLEHKDAVLVSPLFNHYSLEHVPALGSDWAFWQTYSTTLLKKCDEMLVLMTAETPSSVGVQEEIKLAQSLGIKITQICLPSYEATKLPKLPVAKSKFISGADSSMPMFSHVVDNQEYNFSLASVDPKSRVWLAELVAGQMDRVSMFAYIKGEKTLRDTIRSALNIL